MCLLVDWLFVWLVGWLGDMMVDLLLIGWLAYWFVALGRFLVAIGCEVCEIPGLFYVSRGNLVTFCGRTVSRGFLRAAP